MRFGRNKNNQRVCADIAIRGEEYTCPTCNQPLVLKRGKILLPHFAHFPNKPCIDSWVYDESLWQQDWQKKYPEDNQEVIITHSAQTHRADIIIGNYVVLFQQSTITAKFFNEKTKYFRHEGKEIFWVISADEDMAAGILRINRNDHRMMFWDHPPAYLKKVDLKKDKYLHIILDLGNGKLRKVEWVAPDSNFERFIVDSSFNPNLLTEDGCKEAAMNQYARFDTLKERNRPWRKKAGSTGAAPEQSWYMCEKTGDWHLDKCKHCEHNLISEYRSANTRTGTPGGLFFYCCYPRNMNNIVAGKDEQKKIEVPSIWLK